jgi:hypothetical protein
MGRQTKGSTGLADTLEMVPLLSVTFCMRKPWRTSKGKVTMLRILFQDYFKVFPVVSEEGVYTWPSRAIEQLKQNSFTKTGLEMKMAVFWDAAP